MLRSTVVGGYGKIEVDGPPRQIPAPKHFYYILSQAEKFYSIRMTSEESTDKGTQLLNKALPAIENGFFIESLDSIAKRVGRLVDEE